MKSLLALIALAIPLHASQLREIDAVFFCLKHSRDIREVQVPSGEKTTGIRLSTASLTLPEKITLPEDGKLRLLRTASAGNQPVVAATVAIPPALDQVLILLVPAPSSEPAAYRALVLDRAAASFPLGSYRIVNLSPHAIRGAIGRSYIEAKPGGGALLKLSGNPGQVQPLKFEYLNDSGWSRLTESRAAVRDDRRWLLCAYLDPATGRMNLRSIPDRTPAGAPSPLASIERSE